MRVLVTGGDGLLAHSLVPLLRAHHEVSTVSIGDADITDAGFLDARCRELEADAVMHLAAMTAVDGCEAQPEEAFRVNELGTRTVARVCREHGLRLVALSTDYVFDGASRRPYHEADLPNPLSIYGKSKLAAERALAEDGPASWAMVRSAWLFGTGGPNFVARILELLDERDRLTVVDDQVGSPTHTGHLAGGLMTVLESDLTGIVHLTNRGRASWFELARAAAEERGLDPERIQPATTEQIGRPAPRPRFSVLDNRRAEREAGVRLPHWQEALADYLASEEPKV